MTEEQMRQRMKEIDQERNKLASERKDYENYFANKKQQDRLKDHKEYIGKCYSAKEGYHGYANKNKHIRAFKIIDVLEPHHENYAVCVALIDGLRNTCWNEYGVNIMTLNVWGYNELRMINRESDPKVIDFYKEITQEEFEKLYHEYQGNLEDKVYK